MSKQKNSNKKQSMIAGALISSAGIFVAKFIGLFYAVPFNTLLGNEANVAMYGVAYNIYSYLLNIFTAGFPFAVATLIAKYTSKGDYRTSLLVRKLATLVMICFGAFAMLLVIVFSSPLARLVLPASDIGISQAVGILEPSIQIVSTSADLSTMRLVLILISFALFFVPVLSATRGFYQGLKEMEVYALSQVLEQIARVAFLLILSAVAIYMFNYGHVWSVYFGVLSTSVAAILAFIHLKLYDRKIMPQMRKKAKAQENTGITDKKAIMQELIMIAMPYLFSAVLGYSDTIVNTVFLKSGLEAHGSTSEEIVLITGCINYGVLKLMSIPMILAPGFSSAIIPHITSALARQDYKQIRKNIRDCFDIVLYIGVPISFCLFIYAKPLYDILFPPANPADLDTCAQILKWFSIEALISTINPVVTALMMAVGQRRLCIRFQVVMVAVKFALSYPMLKYFGYSGLVLSTMVAMGGYMIAGMYSLARQYHVNWKYTLHKLLIIILGCAGMFLMAWLCELVGLKGYGMGRLMGVVQLGISGLLAMAVYLALTGIFQLPQTLFHIDVSKLLARKRG